MRPLAAAACPGCKEAAFQDPEEARQSLASAKGYGVSIGLMLLIPVALVGGIAFQVARSAWAHKTPPPETQTSNLFDTPKSSR